MNPGAAKGWGGARPNTGPRHRVFRIVRDQKIVVWLGAEPQQATVESVEARAATVRLADGRAIRIEASEPE